MHRIPRDECIQFVEEDAKRWEFNMTTRVFAQVPAQEFGNKNAPIF